MIDPGTVVTILGAACYVGIWAVRLEGKFNTHVARNTEIQSTTRAALTDIKADIKEIRNYLMPPHEKRHDSTGSC